MGYSALLMARSMPETAHITTIEKYEKRIPIALSLIHIFRKTYEFGHDIFYAPGMEALPGTEKTVTLDGTESVADVGKLLEDAGLIRDHVAFSIQAKCYDYEVKKGSFSLNTSQSSKEIINILDEETKKE